MEHLTFERVITTERERLTTERAELESTKQRLQDQVAGIERELGAIDAYEAVRTGKQVRPRAVGGQPREVRARRGSKRQLIVDTLRASAMPLTRGELLTLLDAKGDRKAEMSVSNCLTALVRSNVIVRKHRVYRMPNLDEQRQAA